MVLVMSMLDDMLLGSNVKRNERQTRNECRRDPGLRMDFTRCITRQT